MRQLGEYGTLLAVSSALVICQRGAAIEGELMPMLRVTLGNVEESVPSMRIADICVGTMAWYEEDKLGKRHYDT